MQSDHAPDYASMTREELLSLCSAMCAERGVGALAYPALKAVPRLYPNLYAKGLSQKALLKELGKESDYREWLASQPRVYGAGVQVRWSWAKVVSEAQAVKEAKGHLPPAMWFQKNGHGSLVSHLYAHGRDWADLRAAVGDFSGSNFVESRNGLRWLSHAEASLSNFLHARGVAHEKGRRYDEAYAAMADRRYAIYDMSFVGRDGVAHDVEVWGDRPHGHSEERYAQTRAAKEAFNAGNARFVGVHHADCYDDAKLAAILEPFIGTIAPHRFDKPTDALIQSTHWSNADELLAFCRDLAAKMPGGKFPSEDWLRKRGRWASREGAPYNTLSVYAKLWLGGTRNLRRLLGQGENNTAQWDEASALAAYSAFHKRHGITPNQARHLAREGSAEHASLEAEAARISSAVEKYAGGFERANATLGIEVARRLKWTPEKIRAEFRRIVEETGLTPNQLLYLSKRGEAAAVSAELIALATRVREVSAKLPGGASALAAEFEGIAKPFPRAKRRPRPRPSPQGAT